MSLFGSTGGLAGLGLAEQVGVGTVSPEDVAAEHGGDIGIDGVEQVDERIREEHQRAHAENTSLVSAAAGPGEHNGPEGTGIFQRTGEHVAAEAELIILVSIKVPDAYAALAALLDMVNALAPVKTGIEEMSYIAPSAQLGDDNYVAAFAYISDKVVTGNKVKIYPNVWIGDNVKIGNNVTIYGGAKIYHNCTIGDNCIIHAGAVIGSDGFGYSQQGGIYHKIPQMGNVILENDVEIGANTTIDRAVMGSTIIRQGVKLDNLIQIAHNCEVGTNTVMAAQVGIAGSTKIGDSVVLGGQVGIGGHITIGSKSQIGAQSGIISNIPEGSELLGSPAYPVKNFFRSSIIIPKLPEMYRQLAALEKEIKELKAEKN